MKLAEIRKGLLALTGAVATAVSMGLVSGTAEHWITGVLTVAGTALAVYYVPNAVPVPKPEAPVAIDAG